MNTIDIRFDEQEMNLLRSLIGKHLQSYQHDEFRFTPTSTQAVQFVIEGDTPYYLYSFVESQDYFGVREDVAVWSFSDEKLPIIDKKLFIKTPVREAIKSILLVQENQRTYENNEQAYNVWLTRGIIFDMGENQIAFEKDRWFSEEIIVHKGYALIDQFVSADEFGKDWAPDIITECSREIIVL